MELLPGMVTKGVDFSNIELTRALLRNIEVEGKDCLDLGIMEGMFTTLLVRRGASKVVGYDYVTRTPHIDLVRATLGLDFEYISGMKLGNLRAELQKRGHRPFDVVLFSGVLYHMFDPLAGLALARGLVRDGGILLLETACVVDDHMGMYFNAEGRFYPGTNFWQVSVPCLDYLLRFLRLQAIDCAYFLTPKAHRTTLPLARACVICYAVDHFLPDPDDTWMTKGRNPHYAQFLNWNELVSNEPPVPYQDSQDTLVQRPSGEAIDLYHSMKGMPQFNVGSIDRTLALGAKY
ncbi:MAG: class I SAM-dependent methyltransferase [Rhodothermales bacterium]